MTNSNGPGSDDNIFSLVTNRAEKTAPALDKIERYWNEVRAKRLVPSRCEIDPRGLEGVLGHAFILERIAGGLARFRIAGSHLSDLTGLELRQMPISALFLPGSRDILSEALTAAFDQPAVIRLRIQSASGFGRDHLFGDMILMPLRSDLGDIDRILGGMVLDGNIGRTPRRLDILSQTRQSLTGYAGPQHIHPAPTTSLASDFNAPSPSEPDAVVLPKKTRSPRPVPGKTDHTALQGPKPDKPKRLISERPYLQLVVENDV